MDTHFQYKLYDKIDAKILQEIEILEKNIFGTTRGIEKLKMELSSKFNTTIIIVYNDEMPIAFKIGYERSKRVYYSWMGGVTLKFRGLGLANEMMQIQHNHAVELGYDVINTQSNNKFKNMIILNLKNGFEIKGTLQSIGDDYLTVILEKSLR